MKRRTMALAAVLAVLAAACGPSEPASDFTDATASETSNTTAGTPASTASTAAPDSAVAPTSTLAVDTTVAANPGEPLPLDAEDIVTALSDDSSAGRANDTAGSAAAQKFLVEQLSAFAQPVTNAGGVASFQQPFEGGTNILAVIPGGDLADQYVMIGAHYDHLGSECPTNDPADTVCNGATDNAAGVAAAVSVARSIAAAGTPRRSVLIALWDREEDGLLGSANYVLNPVLPLASLSAYLNFDILGDDLSPSLADTTIVVGAETGGQNLLEAVDRAEQTTTLRPVGLSLVFGQGRSDHANLVSVGVPSVFFTDANSGCYHTAQDDLAHANLPKLDQQIAVATALAQELVATDTPPVFDPAAKLARFEDALGMLDVVQRAQSDFGLLAPEEAAAATQYLGDLERVVQAGPMAFDDAAIGTVLGGAAALVQALSLTACQP